MCYTMVDANMFLEWDATRNAFRQKVREIRGDHVVYSNLIMMKDPSSIKQCLFAKDLSGCANATDWTAKSKNKYLLIRVFMREVNARDAHTKTTTTYALRSNHSTDCTWVREKPTDCEIAMSALAMLPRTVDHTWQTQ